MIGGAFEFELLEATQARTFNRPDGRSDGVAADLPEAPRGSRGIAVRIAGVEKRFGKRTVLQDLTLDIAPGEFLAIVGHSGCGKSTLLRLIAGLDTPSTGQIDIGEQGVRERTRDVRLMFQDSRLLPWRRVLDNVGIGLKGPWRNVALAALSAVGLESRGHDWPAVLSGGQRQRVALARALVSQPKLLLLDEPLGALDALTRLDMQRLIEAVWYRHGFTAVLVTHDVTEALSLADRVIILDQGKVDFERRISHARPRRRGDADLAALEGDLLARLLRRERWTVQGQGEKRQ